MHGNGPARAPDDDLSAWAKELYDLAAAPHQLEIVAGSDGHGVAVFDDDPTLQQRILTVYY